MKDFATDLKILDDNFSSFSQELGRLEGQKDLLSKQLVTSKAKVEELENQKILETKAVELLHLVQRSTRDRIKEAFEQTVTFALKSIYQKDYQFQLDFSQRGNLGELDFKLKAPENQGFLDIKDCTAGGSFDIISLALRFVLLQVMRPKVEGFVVLDEPTKMLSREFRANEYNFYKYIAEKLGRQLLIITHSQELIDSAEQKILIGA
jgi:DNA repair exonuclease SbcCD ATPase subunit